MVKFDTRSIFKGSNVGFNSKSSFSKTCYFTKELSMSNSLPIPGRKDTWQGEFFSGENFPFTSFLRQKSRVDRFKPFTRVTLINQ